jgi:hypothetical protein
MAWHPQQALPLSFRLEPQALVKLGHLRVPCRLRIRAKPGKSRKASLAS